VNGSPRWLRTLLALVLAPVILAGCASPPATARWEVGFDTPARARAAAFVEARIRRGACSTGEIVREYGRVGRDGIVEMPGAVLPPGRYCFEVEAIDRICVRYAGASRLAELPSATPIALELSPILAVRECDPLICREGTCDLALDGGVDGGNDGGSTLRDANQDADLRPPDAGPLPPVVARGCGELAVSTTASTTVSAGRAHTCALVGVFGAQSLSCWGADDHGQLGLGGRGEARLPTHVPGLYLAVSAGDEHTCALGPEGALYCWGRNERGQLGLGDTEDRDTPTRVPGSFSLVSAGGDHTCAVRQNESMMGAPELTCWGANDHGQLGAPGPDRLVPTVVWTLLTNAVAAGATHTCAGVTDTMTFSTTTYCWGESGPWLGHASGPSTPTPIDAEPGFTSGLAAGRHVSCDSGFDPGVGTVAARCWGEGANGRLLDATALDSAIPRVSEGLGPAPGGTFTCQLGPTAGGVACAGDPSSGIRGPSPGPGLAPSLVMTGGSAVFAGDRHACANSAVGLVCWGANDRGQLGTGAVGEIEATPTRVCF